MYVITQLFLYIFTFQNYIPESMYRYLLPFFVLISSLTSSAQKQYTDFSVNKKYGVVNVTNLDEYVAPSYTKQVFFTDDYLGFEKGIDLEFYNKKTGQLSTFSTAELHYHLYVKTKEYLHIATKENKSALLDQRLSITATFPDLYNSINNFLFTPFIIAKSKNGFDIYNTRQTPFKLVYKQIKATDYSIIKIWNKENELEFYAVFYGKEKVYLYTEDFSLMKTIPAHAATEKEAIAVLKSHYNVDDGPENFDPPIAAERAHWYLVKVENGYKIYETQLFSTLFLKIKERFTVESTWSDEVSVSDKSNGDIYIFNLDGKNKKALIPLKYQQLMGLEIIEKQ